MMRSILLQTGRASALTFLAATASLNLQAQQPIEALPVPSVSTAAPQYPALDLQAALKNPFNSFDHASSSSSSVSGDAPAAEPAERLTLSDSLQPPPRRRYGRPRYTDNQHNADGSSKYAFEAGGGLTLPTGGTHNDLKTSFNFQGGVGRNFNQNFGVMAQFDWANFGIQTRALNNLLSIYDNPPISATDQNGAALTQLNGSSHIWSFTLNPIYYFAGGEKSGAYVVVGAGFYHKTANFTIPSIGQYCDPYYGCYQYQANQSIDKYASNAFGVNGGVGFTYKPSRFGNQKFFAEARYVFVDNSPRPFSTGSTTNTYFNVFPQNSARTTYIPITFGIRF